MEMQFLPVSVDPAEVIGGPDGLITRINDQEIPVVGTLFTVRIIQPGSLQANKELAKNVGEFWIPDLQETRSSLRVIPIEHMGHGKRYYAPYDPDNNELLCYSSNGLTPNPRVERPFSDVCAIKKGREFVPVCAESKWSGKTPGPCRDTISLALFDVDLKIPLKLQLAGTSIPVWNKFQRSYATLCSAARIRGKSLKDHVLVMATESYGTYYKLSLEFKEAKKSKPSELYPLLRWYSANLIPLFLDKPDNPEILPTTTTVGEEAMSAEAEAEAKGFDV